MPPVEFDPTISAGERRQTYALDRAATGTGTIKEIIYNNKHDTAILNKVSRINDEQEHKEGKTQKDGLNSNMLEDRPNLSLSYSNTLISKFLSNRKHYSKLLARNKNINPKEFNKCGVYQLTCHDYNRSILDRLVDPFR
jgi:hypothetical protein